MAEIYKTFNDVISDTTIAKFNPYHDKLGRFTGKKGAITGCSTSEESGLRGKNEFIKTGELRENGNEFSLGPSTYTNQVMGSIRDIEKETGKKTIIDSIEEIRADGRIYAWNISLGGKEKATIELSGNWPKDDCKPIEYEDDFIGTVQETLFNMNHDIDAMERGDFEYFRRIHDDDTCSEDLDINDYMDRTIVLEMNFGDSGDSDWYDDDCYITQKSGPDIYEVRDSLQAICDGVDNLYV